MPDAEQHARIVEGEVAARRGGAPCLLPSGAREGDHRACAVARAACPDQFDAQPGAHRFGYVVPEMDGAAVFERQKIRTAVVIDVSDRQRTPDQRRRDPGGSGYLAECAVAL